MVTSWKNNHLEVGFNVLRNLYNTVVARRQNVEGCKYTLAKRQRDALGKL